MEYCETCTPDALVTAWAEGRQHERPAFGDYAQMCVAQRKRATAYQRAKVENPSFAMHFPEFMHEHKKGIRGHIDVMVCHFDRLVASVPAFAAYTAEHRPSAAGSRGGKRIRRRRAGEMRSWKRQSVHNFFFVNRKDTAAILRSILSVLGLAVPSWLILPPAKGEPVEMLMAA